MNYPTNYAPFNAELAALDPLYNLPAEDSDKYDYHVSAPKPDSLLEAFADVWMEVVEDDENVAANYEALLIDIASPSTTPTTSSASPNTPSTAPLVIEIDLDETDTTTATAYGQQPQAHTAAMTTTAAMDMDDAVSVVSVEEEVKAQRPMQKNSSFINTCWDIDTFMARAVQCDA